MVSTTTNRRAVIQTYEQALSWLGAEAGHGDDQIIAVAGLKVRGTKYAGIFLYANQKTWKHFRRGDPLLTRK